MSRTNANPTSPLTQLKTLGRHTCAVGRQLRSWISRAVRSLLCGGEAREGNKLCRIYTEDIRRAQILDVLDRSFSGYTVFKGLGRWQGRSESSLVIEVVTADLHAVRKAAADIRKLNKQECVIVVVLAAASVEFITVRSKNPKRGAAKKPVSGATVGRSRSRRLAS